MKRKYEEINFNPVQKLMIQRTNQIVESYQKQGYKLSVRQIYYQFVSRIWFPADRKFTNAGGKWVKDLEGGSENAEPNYKWLARIISDGRVAGLIDWSAIEDRNRELTEQSHWSSPNSIVSACASQYKTDWWKGQPQRVEVFVEKAALEGVVERVHLELDFPFFSCRGYTSQSAVWEAGQRLDRVADGGQTPVVLHMGDHDPSGIDMSRDIERKLRLFMDDHGVDLVFERIALNFDQVQKYNPPPNPTKMTDSRSPKYNEAYGDECWELDALNPTILADLIREKVREHILDADAWEEQQEKQWRGREELTQVSEGWDVAVDATEEPDKDVEDNDKE